jgi:hypothetical protein
MDLKTSIEKPEQSNLAPSARFVSMVLSRFVYPILRKAKIVEMANMILANSGDENGTQSVELRLVTREKKSEATIAIEKSDLSPEDKQRAKTTAGNFIEKLALNIKPKPAAVPENAA